MTPDFWNGVGTAVERFGLPLAVLFVFGILLFKRWLVLGAELTNSAKACSEQVAFMQKLWQDEREARIAAEREMREQTQRLMQLAETFDGSVDAILDAIEGRPHGRR